MTRLVLFLAALAALFGAAAGLGRAVGPLERGSEPDAHAGDAEPMDAHGAARPVGLALAENGFRFVPARTEITTGPSRFAFRIAGARRFDIVHARRMHLIVVRRDLGFFRHVHPRQLPDGAWTVALDVPTPGVYRAFADFSAAGKRTVLGVDLFARGRAYAESTTLHIPEPRMRRDGGMLRFDVGGRPLPYLGARGHLVVLREGDLAYVHTHPKAGELAFELELPTPGRYRAFLQWRNGLGVQTAEFPLVQR